MIADFSCRTSRQAEMFGNRDDWLERQLLKHSRMTPDELKNRTKLGTTEEEADETEDWLTILVEKGTVRQEQVASLLDEADQLVRIIVASIKTARRNGKRQ